MKRKLPAENQVKTGDGSQEDESRGGENMLNAPTMGDPKGDEKESEGDVNPSTEPPNENGRGGGQ